MKKELQHCQSQRVTRADMADQPVGFITQILKQHSFKVGHTNAIALQFLSVAVFRQLRMTTEQLSALLYSSVKLRIFKRVQSVVMHKHRDRSLRGQIMRTVFEDAAQIVDFVGINFSRLIIVSAKSI